MHFVVVARYSVPPPNFVQRRWIEEFDLFTSSSSCLLSFSICVNMSSTSCSFTRKSMGCNNYVSKKRNGIPSAGRSISTSTPERRYVLMNPSRAVCIHRRYLWSPRLHASAPRPRGVSALPTTRLLWNGTLRRTACRGRRVT